MHFSVPEAPFYIGDVLPSPVLQRAQAYVDLFTKIPGKVKKGERPHPFRVVLDSLEAAEAKRRKATAQIKDEHDHREYPNNNGGDGNACKIGQKSPLEDLQEAFGVTVGSSLYRDCVQRPRDHLHAVVGALGRVLEGRFLRPLANRGKDEEKYDVHVQLWPSSRAFHGAKGVPLRICAAVVIRRCQALRLVESRRERLEGRLMSVAALGQTLESSLAFWKDVCVGDSARGELAAYARLGLEPFPELGLSGVDEEDNRDRHNDNNNDEEEEEEGRKGAKIVLGSWFSVRKQYVRRLPVELRTSVHAPTMARRLFDDDEERENGKTEKKEGGDFIPKGLWRQPDELLEDSVKNSPVRSSEWRVRQSPEALVAVLYISLEGMVYPVKMTDIASLQGGSLGNSSEVSHDLSHTTPVPLEENSAERNNRLKTTPLSATLYNGWFLPFHEDDSFTRAALGM